MNLFDIIGPVMVGPSSSHTAGAVKIGYIARKIMDEPIVKAQILLYGSFFATGRGHGTDKAIVAGLLGMKADDERIPNSIECAKEVGMEIHFGEAKLREAHPNSVMLILQGKSGKMMELIGESIGGSRINIVQIDGVNVKVNGDCPTLIVHNVDLPGYVTHVTSFLSEVNVNIAYMQLYRESRGKDAVMVIECDQEIPKELIDRLEKLDGIVKVIYLSLQD